MLKPISELLSGSEIIEIGMFTTFSAVCMDSGAHLTRSQGRTRSGIPNWTLILPDSIPDNRIKFFKHSSWTHRSQFKAPNLGAAIIIGNERLLKLLARQKKGKS